jgi:hypothetical protein
VYRVTAGKQDQISVDCGTAKGAPKAKSYIGRIVSENYGTDSKGRITTVNVFKREIVLPPEQQEQNAVMRLAAMLPGAVAGGMNGLRAGNIVTFESVEELGDRIDERPGYVINKDAAAKMFERAVLKSLLDSGYIRTMRGCPFLAVFAPVNGVKHELLMPWMTWEGGK